MLQNSLCSKALHVSKKKKKKNSYSCEKICPIIFETIPKNFLSGFSPKNKNNNWDSTGLTGKSESRFMSALNIVCICLAELFPTPLKQWSYEKMKNWICQSGSD